MIGLEHDWLSLALLGGALASTPLWFPWFDDRYRLHADRWMGFIGGVATGYVVLYMFPKLGRITVGIVGLEETASLRVEHLKMYYLLLSAIVFYLVSAHLNASKSRWSTAAGVFDYSVHGAYSGLVGYVFIEIASEYTNVNLMIWTILGLHLVGMNHLLRGNRRMGFDRVARWVFGSLVLAGTGLGLVTELPKSFMNGMTAFLAGIILVNVISEELPLAHRGRVPWYLGGVAFLLVASFLIISLDDPRPAY